MINPKYQYKLKYFFCKSLVFFILIFAQTLDSTQLWGGVIYKDKNGYFVATVPKGWEEQDYPDETVRSKVAFHPPSSDINIRIIVQPAPRNGFNFDELRIQHEAGQNFMQEKSPDGKYSLTVGTIAGHRAVIHRNTYTEVEQKSISFVENDIMYTITLNTATLEEFRSVQPIYERFLESFLVLDKKVKPTDREIRKALLSNCRRLAELSFETGMYQKAYEFINQALDIEPNNVELKKLKQKIESEKRKEK